MTPLADRLEQHRFTQAMRHAIHQRNVAALQQGLAQPQPVSAALLAEAAGSDHPEVLPLVVARTDWPIQAAALRHLLEPDAPEARQRLLPFTAASAQQAYLKHLVQTPMWRPFINSWRTPPRCWPNGDASDLSGGCGRAAGPFGGAAAGPTPG